MICDDGWLADLILAMGFIGLAAGSVLLSWMSSYFGRRLVLGIGHLLCTVFIGVQIMSPSPHFFAILTALICFGIGGAAISCFLLMIEITDTSKRSTFACILWMHWGLSYIIVNFLIEVFIHWRHLYVLLFVVSLGLLGTMYFISESPRCLTANMGEFHIARMILRRIAVTNRMPYFEGMLEGEKLIGYIEPEAEPPEN